MSVKSWYSKNRQNIPMWLTIGVFAVCGIFSLFLIADLYVTTVVHYEQYARAASSDQWKMMTYSSGRGVIYDANGNPLASNTYDYTVVCSPNSLARSENFDRELVISTMSSVLEVDREKLESIIPVNPDDQTDERNLVMGCDIKKNVSVEVKEQLELFIRDNKIDGIAFVAVPQRYYNYGSLCSQVIGYATNDGVSLVGRAGLEYYYDDLLSGYNGYRYSEVDSRTDGVLPYSEATSIEAVDGNSIVLNIDVNIQRIAEEACRRAYDQYQPRGGVTAIVMQPYTGAVLAMVSLPDYDLNDPYGMPYGMDPTVWATYTSDEQVEYLMGNVWRNRCISDTYEPGSTFKALTTAIAFEENLTNENEVFSDSPIPVDDFTISCWLTKQNGGDHGMETLQQAFENSCNPVFARVAERIQISRYYQYVHMFGFYEVTGIDLPGEAVGIFHEDPSQLDMFCLSFGESATVTPIQLLNSYCAIINGGNLMVPHLVRYITDSNGNIVDEIEPEVIRSVLSEDTSARVRRLMAAVVESGTGSAGQVPGYSVAGKTSTSTIDVGEERGMHVLSFSCFAPADNPQIAVLVVLNRPEDRSVGSSSTAAIAARIVEGTLSYLGVPRVLSEEEYADITRRYYVMQVAGMTAGEASSAISANGGISTVYGSPDMTGDTIIGYTYPDTTAQLYSSGIVMLYPEVNADGSEVQPLTSAVPNLRGKSAIECIEALRDVNLNCHIEGDVMGICTGQSDEAGAVVFSGTIVTVTLESPEEITEETDENDAITAEDGVVMTEPEESEAASDEEENTTTEG